MQLAERVRPKTLDDVIGQDRAKKRIECLAKNGLGGRGWWINGISGTGKSTIAKIIADKVAGDWHDEINVGECTVKAICDWERKLRSKPIGGTGHALICNEAHGLRRDAIRQWLDTLERLPSYACVIFTTTNSAQKDLFEDQVDAHPLMSRCQVLELNSSGPDLELAFACHLRTIAAREGLYGKPITSYVELVRKCRFNLRACLQEVESGVMIDG